jgi:3',5'-cyclic AMP phosphodiesterase CpdA
VSDPVNQPGHYTSHPSGVECIVVTEHLNFCVGNAVKYLWRAGLKPGDALAPAAVADHLKRIEDLKKARWYVDREIQRLEKIS